MDSQEWLVAVSTLISRLENVSMYRYWTRKRNLSTHSVQCLTRDSQIFTFLVLSLYSSLLEIATVYTIFVNYFHKLVSILFRDTHCILLRITPRSEEFCIFIFTRVSFINFRKFEILPFWIGRVFRKTFQENVRMIRLLVGTSCFSKCRRFWIPVRAWWERKFSRKISSSAVKYFQSIFLLCLAY